MSTYKFFGSCLKATREKYYDVLTKPATSRKYINEYRKVMNDLDMAIQYNELTKEEGEELKKQFKEYDYIAYKKRINKTGM